MTDCNRLKPLTQLQIDLPENISKRTRNANIDVPVGFLIHMSGLSTFKQMPETDNSYKTINFGTKNRPSYKPVKTTVYHGVNVDEGFDTELYCPCCGAKLYCNGSQPVVLNHLPEGSDYTKVLVDRRRYRCSGKKCSYNYTYEPEYKANGFMITKPLLNYVENLLRLGMTLKSIALMTGLNKNTVKRIDKKRLKVLYTETDENGNTVLKNPETNSKFLAVDEFKLHDGYKFATVIIDLETGYILHLSHGKKKKCVYEFIDRVGDEWMSRVEAVAVDMNSDFEEAFLERCPHLRIVFDYFHIVKNFNEKVITKVRIAEQKRLKEEGREDEAKALKGVKYILTSNRSTLEKKDEDAAEGKLVSRESKLFNKPEVKAKGGQMAKYLKLIEENALLSTCDIVKTMLQEAYKCTEEDKMREKIKEIISTCRSTQNSYFCNFAKLLENHLDGITSHAVYHISTGRLEGINNLIKTVRRTGYGYPDDEYFFLKLFDRSRR